MLAKRNGLSPRERIEAAQGLRHVLETLPEFMVDTHIAGYWAMGGELPLNLAQAGLAQRGQHWHLPVIGDDRSMRFARWQAGDAVAPNRYGIPEPQVDAGALLGAEAVQLVLVPLLGFDRFGQRIGFGGGFYDRAFDFLNGQDRPAHPLLVGVGYVFQEVDAIMPQPWDVRLDYVATERELIDCNALGTGH
ncbi:5-formyltetrahydrofolate cyclo-ligase [Oleiagrimonas sp. C23AA]|nr:5-formyltetrahydrofolate cyclo-ligase [Oleiagrimonas sp. C23AA]NII09772.1 5-formyltetrahydrofolate cyclo-ligase [Oleiagrimonas sp. C23AA]